MAIWDYFMRRKWLLLTVLAVFLLSGVVSGYFLQNSDTYIVDSAVFSQPEEVKDESPDTVARVQVPILSEEEASALSVAKAEAERNADTISTEQASSEEPTLAEAGAETGETTSTTQAESRPEASMEAASATTDSQATSSDESAGEPQAVNPATSEIDVPLAGGSAQDDINEAWKTLFAAWQQATWTIFGAIALALLVVLFARWSLFRKLR